MRSRGPITMSRFALWKLRPTTGFEFKHTAITVRTRQARCIHTR